MFDKTCEACGESFEGRASGRRFCSRACSDDWKRGRPNPKNAGPKYPPEERFWAKVNKRSPDECWEWQGGCEVGGYGLLYREGGKGTGKPQRMWKAHRFCWALHNGPIPVGLDVLHNCDNPPCVNPAHLYVGTQADNNRDRGTRKRGKEHRQRGSANDNAKLTDAQVAEIRQRVAAGETQTVVAREYGVRQPHISRIVRGISR